MGIFRRLRHGTDWEERLAKVEARQKVIEAEWESCYLKFRSLYGRLAKKAWREEHEENGEEKPPRMPSGARSPTEPYPTTNPLALALLKGHHRGVLPDG
jgi:hypothetical protein